MNISRRHFAKVHYSYRRREAEEKETGAAKISALFLCYRRLGSAREMRINIRAIIEEAAPAVTLLHERVMDNSCLYIDS